MGSEILRRVVTRTWPSLLAGVMGTVVAIGVFWAEYRRATNDCKEEFVSEVASSANRFEHQYRMYKTALRSSAGLFYAREQVSASEWNNLVSYAFEGREYDGIERFVYIERVPLEAVESYEREMSDTKGEPFAIYKRPGRRQATDFAAPIRFINSQDPNHHLIGLDVASSGALRSALRRASLEGALVRTSGFRFDLTDGTDRDVVLCYPVYHDASLSALAPDARAEATRGWVAISLPLETELAMIQEGLTTGVDIEIGRVGHDGRFNVADGWPGADGRWLDPQDVAFTYKAMFQIEEYRWAILASSPSPGLAALAANATPVTLVTIVLGALVVALFYVAGGARRRATILAESMTSELERKEKLLQDAGRLAQLGGWELDVETLETRWSEQTRRIHEVDDDYDVTLGNAIDFYEGNARSVISFAIEQCMKTGKPFDLQLPFVTAPGNKRWVRSLGQAEFVNGKIVRLHGAFQDVTEQVETEEELVSAKRAAENASFSKGQFLANMSHEIRTPMTAILGYTDVLASPGLAHHEREDAIRTIRRNGEHLLGILNDILDVSKIESGRLQVESVPTSIRELLAQVDSLYGGRAREKGLAFETVFNSAIPESVLTDPTRVRQILFNLASNAIKFTERGSITIAVEYASDIGRLWFRVADTGIGMTEEAAERVFDSFSQADTTSTRRYGGTGLGLQISRSLAEMLKGDLQVTSQVGRGSVFTLSMDVAVDPAKPALIPPEEIDLHATDEESGNDGNRPARTLVGVRVLVAEDGPDNQRLVRHYLTKCGAVVTLVNNGRRAVESYEKATRLGRRFDLVIMDMQMPVMDGYDATAALRDMGCETPVIALTAHAMKSDREKCLRAGCDEFVAKPFQFEQFINACLDTIASKRASRDAA